MLEETTPSAAIRGVADLFGGPFGAGDLSQQVVGGFLLAGPFVVTEEVWNLARAMTWYQGGVSVMIVFVVGYVALYEANEEREEAREPNLQGIPYRYLSLVLVSYLSVFLMMILFSAPVVFGAGVPTTLKALSIDAIFSVVGAATADSIF